MKIFLLPKTTTSKHQEPYPTSKLFLSLIINNHTEGNCWRNKKCSQNKAYRLNYLIANLMFQLQKKNDVTKIPCESLSHVLFIKCTGFSLQLYLEFMAGLQTSQPLHDKICCYNSVSQEPNANQHHTNQYYCLKNFTAFSSLCSSASYLKDILQTEKYQSHLGLYFLKQIPKTCGQFVYTRFISL